MPWYEDPSIWFSVLANALAVYAIYIAKQGDRRLERQEKQDKEDREWAGRLEKVSKHLIRISPSLSVKEPGTDFQFGVYTVMYPEQALQHLIEEYVVATDRNRAVFTPRTLAPHELRSSLVRDTIMKTEKGLEVFLRTHPVVAKDHLDL